MRKRGARPALTLLEVVIALAIFLLAMTVFSQMLLRNGEIARDVQRQNLATRLCQSKLAEVVAGVVPLSSQSDASFEEEPDYTWSLTADNGSVAGLWNVTVSVTRQPTDSGNPVQCSLTQMVLDPSIIGSTQDAPAVSGTATTSDNSTSATPAAAATPAVTPAATPAPTKAATPAPTKAATPTPASSPTPVKGK